MLNNYFLCQEKQIKLLPSSLNKYLLCFILKVCGGGPSLSIWHLRTMTCTSVLNTSSMQQAAVFHDDLVSQQTLFPGSFISPA